MQLFDLLFTIFMSRTAIDSENNFNNNKRTTIGQETNNEPDTG